MSNVAQVSTTIQAGVETIWRALTIPETIKQYFFGSDVESDFRRGSSIVFRGEHQGKTYEDKGEILEVEPERRLVFSHWSPLSGMPDKPENYHVVAYDLSPLGNSTKVTLTQSNMSGEVTKADLEQKEQFEKNWSIVLEGLKKTVEAEKGALETGAGL